VIEQKIPKLIDHSHEFFDVKEKVDQAEIYDGCHLEEDTGFVREINHNKRQIV